MKIIWQGHACFRIEGFGVSIVTDPYDPKHGFAAMTEPADVVVRSAQEDDAHGWHQMVPGDHELVDAVTVSRTGPVVKRGVRFEAFPTRERPSPLRRDVLEDVAMYHFTVDGVRVLHTGDVGIPIPDDQIERLRGRVDVMIAVTGDRLTIALEDLTRAIGEIRPRVVIPCHYQVRALKPRGYFLYPVEAFLSKYPEAVWVYTNSTQVEFTPETLPKEFRIYVMEHVG
jgi:L-ascorbate metabolism protein UlaG (beta-lactamase superfamily)